jgi:hypothetical protein
VNTLGHGILAECAEAVGHAGKGVDHVARLEPVGR